MPKNRKMNLPEDEEELQRMERENGIIPKDEENEKKHPHEMLLPVGEEPGQYMEEELTEQGYTETGLESLDDEEGPQSNPDTGRKAA